MNKRRTNTLIYWLILMAAAGIYAVMSLSDNVWADEAYTFAMLRHSFGEIWNITAADVHPPLYYYAAKLFSLPFGYSQYAVRLFSGLCYWLILAIGGWQIGKSFSQRTGLLFMALFLLYPFSIDYMAEARMYPLAALAVFLNAMFAYRVWTGNRAWDWVGFAAAGLCAAYTHYFALVAAGIIYGLLFLCCLIKNRKLLKPWLAASAVTIVLYLPWLKCFVEQLAFKVNNEYWIEPITPATLFEYLISLLHANGSSIFPLFFGLLGLTLLGILIVKRQGAALLALLVPLLTIGLGVGVSMLIRPIFIIRYLAPCGPLVIFFVAVGITSFRRELLVGAAAGMLLMGFAGNMLFAAAGLIPGENKMNKAFIQEHADAEAHVVISDNYLHFSQSLAFYDSETPIYVPETMGAASPYEHTYALDAFNGENLHTILVYTNEGSGPNGPFPKDFKATLIGTYHDVYDYVDVWLMTR